MRILLVDDDKIIRYGLKKIIEKSEGDFIIVGEANNGATALEMITNTNPDVIITDIKMPIMNGIELIEKIKENKFTCKIIALSGFDEYKFVRESLKNGATDYLLKPINNDDLISLLNTLKNDIEEEKRVIREYVNNMEESKNIINEMILNKLISKDENIDENFINRIEALDLSQFNMIVISFRTLAKNQLPKLICEIKNLLKGNIGVISDDVIISEYENNIVIMYKTELCEKIDELVHLIIEKNKNVLYYKEQIKSENIKELYEKAIKKILENFYGEEENYKDIISEEYKNCIDEICGKIIDAIELLDSNSLIKNLRFMFGLLKKYKINPNAAITMLLNMIDTCKLKINDFNKAYEVNKFINEVEVKEYIYNMKCLKDAEVDITKFFVLLIDNIKKVRDGRSDKIIEYAKEYIKENYNKNITLSDVANKVYLNSNYLSELFKKKVGKNFSEYLIELRISIAKEKLKEPGIRIYEVANEVGYKEQVSFNRAFKRTVGISPKEYINLVK